MIFVTGDTHGIYSRFDDPRLRRLGKGDTLIICGDFGFLWNGSKEEINILKKLSKKKYNICFVDGTHENFELLSKLKIKKWNGGKVHHIASNIFHLMRGQIFTIEDVKIFTMGGGESPDLEYRLEETSWYKYEIPSKEELLEIEGFGGIMAAQWILFIFYAIIRRSAFEVETVAFFLCTMGIAALSSIKPGETLHL